MSLEIKHLHECPEFLTEVATWIHEQWWARKEGHSVETMAARLSEAKDPDSIPLSLVALEDGSPVGTVNLVVNDNEDRPDLSPWLAALLVKRESRGRGIGKSLVHRLVQEAGRLEVPRFYLGTDIPDYYTALGASMFDPGSPGEYCIMSMDPPRGRNALPRINRLIVLAGPSGSGKNFLVGGMLEGRHPGLCEQLQIEDPRKWTFTNAFRLGRMTEDIDRLLLHYDLSARHPKDPKHEFLQKVLARSNHASLVTLHVSADTLVRRKTGILLGLVKSLLHPNSYRGDHLRRMKRGGVRAWRTRRDDKAGVSERVYREWFVLARELPGRHWILDYENPHVDTLRPA